MDLKQIIVARIETVKSLIETLREFNPKATQTIAAYQYEKWALEDVLSRYEKSQDEIRFA